MSSESSLLTTAASDTSSSADSRYCSSHARRSNFSTAREATSKPAERLSPPVQASRRRSYNLKARGVVIAKAPSGGGNQKVLCVCKVCKGQRLVSKSTCYRHLRVEAEIAEDDMKREARWSPYTNASHREALRMYQFIHLAGIRLGFVQWESWRPLAQDNFAFSTSGTDFFPVFQYIYLSPHRRGHGRNHVT